MATSTVFLQVSLFVSGYYLGIQVIAQVTRSYADIRQSYAMLCLKVLSEELHKTDRKIRNLNIAQSYRSRNFSTAMGKYHINNKGDLDNDFGVRCLSNRTGKFEVSLFSQSTGANQRSRYSAQIKLLV